MNHGFSKSGFILLCSLISFVCLPPGQILADTAEKVAVKIMEKETVGKYLADAYGMSLYRFTKDEQNNSHCIEGCAVNWPPFHADSAEVEEGLEPGDFAVITRTDSRQQTTYQGMPLYYFKNDKFPGDTFGDGIGDVWYLVTP